jgi:hypothetical protein
MTWQATYLAARRHNLTTRESIQLADEYGDKWREVAEWIGVCETCLARFPGLKRQRYCSVKCADEGLKV